MKKSVIFLVFGILLISFVSAEERFHVVLSNEQNFVFMENDGAGKFTARTTIDASPLAHEITAGDFDLDGIEDAAVNHHQEGAFTVLWGNKDHTFTKQKVVIPVVQNGEMHAIGSGDFDEDGDIDLALVDNGFPKSVVIAFSDGKRGFSEFKKNDMANNDNARVIKVNDFNGDKHLDFIVPESGGDNYFIFFGDGHGNFDMKEISGGGRLHAIESGDIDNDGDIDIAFADFLNINILKNDGNGKFNSLADSFCIKNTQGLCTNPDFFAVELSDLDHDGFIDVIGLRADGLYIWRGDGTGKFKASARKPASVEFNQIFRNSIDIESVDVDGDRVSDVIIGALEGTQNIGQTGILVFKNKIDAAGCKEPDPNNPGRFIILGPGPICVDSVVKYSAGRTNFPDQVMIDVYKEDVKETLSFTRGDVNQDKAVDLSDAVYLLQYLFQAGEKPKCMDAGDFDDSGVIDVSDPIYLLTHLFLAGPALPDPFKDAGGNLIVGEDKTDDQLGCEFYPK